MSSIGTRYNWLHLWCVKHVVSFAFGIFFISYSFILRFTYTLQAKNISPSTKEKQIPPPPQSKKIKFFDTPLLAVILYKDKAIGFFLGFYIKNYMHFDITREDKI